MDQRPAHAVYAEIFKAQATQLATYRHAREWMKAGVPAEEAAAWASLGFQAGEAAPYIADGMTPEMYADGEDAGIAAAGGEQEYRRLQLDRIAGHGVLIDPDIAERLGLDDPR